MSTDIPRRLAEAMRKAGLVDQRNDTASRNAWSKAAGVHTSTISRWLETGRVRSDNARKLAEALGVQTSEMYSLAGMPATSAPWAPPQGTESLTARQKAALSELVLAFMDERDQGAGSAGRDTTDHPPTSQGTPGETNEGEKTLRLGDYRKATRRPTLLD